MDRRRGLLLAAGATAFAFVTTAFNAASGGPPEFLVADLVMGLTFVVAGLVAHRLRPTSPTGPWLIVAGALWFVGSYAPSGQPVVTHLGFAFERYYDLVLAGLLLRLSTSDQRLRPAWLIAGLAVAILARSGGRLLLQDPVLLYECLECPPNPFALFPDRTAFETIEVVTSVAIGLGFVAIGLVAMRRLVDAGPLWRRVRWPILAAGGLAMAAAALDAFEYAWSTATGEQLIQLAEPLDQIVSWLAFGARTLVPIGFLVATIRLQRAAGPLGRFAARLDRPPDGGDHVGDALRTTLDDPSLRVLRPAPDGAWRAEDGSPAEPPVPTADRTVTLVGEEDRPVAAILHDPALDEQPELLEAVIRVLRLALDNERLEMELREQLQAVTESRERIVSAAEDERRRLERDLHDGAQQRLVGVMLALQQAREAADADRLPDGLRAQLDAAAGETTEAIRELRELARGIHPAILEDEGLGAAVTALARRAVVPVDVHLELDGRLPRIVESTAYFTIAEALTNAQRHARAGQASVHLAERGDALELVVEDDGQGGAALDRGTGLRGLADRVAAVGGRLEVDSAAGRGTRIRARIPTR